MRVANELARRSGDIGLPIPRWSGLAALLLAQILYLTIRFDSVTQTGQDGLWARLVAQSSVVPQLLLVVVTATLVFGGGELHSGISQLSRVTGQYHGWWQWCIAQLSLFVAFVPVTSIVFEGHDGLTFISPYWSVVWSLMGVAIVTSLGFAMLPPSVWLALAIQHRSPLLWGAIVGMTAWGAGQLSESLWRPLGESTFWLVSSLLRSIGTDVLLMSDEFVIGTPTFLVRIAPACSGYEGIGLAWVFVGTYLWWKRQELHWPQAWLLLPLATGLMWLSNGIRIAGLILIGSYGWQDVALGGFHSQAGWLAFNGVALGIIVISRRSRFFSASCATNGKVKDFQPTAAYLMPLLALLATVMVTSAITSGFDWLYPLRIVVVVGVVAAYARSYRFWNWNWSWSAAGLGVATFGLWLALEPASTVPSEQDRLAVALTAIPASWAAAWLLFRVFGSVIVIPLAEELAFRGYLTRRLISMEWSDVPPGQFSWFSLVASSALFGALHSGRFWAGTLAGVLYAVALYRRGNVFDAVLAHATTNALIACYVLPTGSWNLWN